jgi:enoyl-CoA hydratase
MIQVERRGNVAVARMRAGKANAMNARVLDAIARTFDDVERSDAAAVVIIGDGRYFSGGLAVPELYAFDRAAMAELMERFTTTMRRVLEFPRPTVAAIDGHAIAGGCVLALMCDARVMGRGDARIGLNEVQLGIGLPAIVVEPLRARVSPAAWTEIALAARLFSADEAARLQLVDELVDASAVEARAIDRARELGRSPLAYAQVKRALLAPVLDALAARDRAEREVWLDTWFSPDARRLIGEAVARITKR